MEEAGSARVSHAAHFSVSADIERPPQGTCAHRGECSEAHPGKKTAISNASRQLRKLPPKQLVKWLQQARRCAIALPWQSQLRSERLRQTWACLDVHRLEWLRKERAPHI